MIAIQTHILMPVLGSTLMNHFLSIVMAIINSAWEESHLASIEAGVFTTLTVVLFCRKIFSWTLKTGQC